MKTYSAKPAEFPVAKRGWTLVDADGKVLGRIASKIADILRGKNRPTFTPHVDTGDFVVVINADKVKLTGAKLDQKIYYNHTGFFGHLKSATAREVMAKNSAKLIYEAVEGMLPKNRLSRQLIKKLKVYAGPQHPHAAQQPSTVEMR
ncbi:MAG: 50S ribosomal protein L13 [Nitrospinae bacterium]|nr:50S ribosomal protein L13 [Nitrospinota bacterium]